MKRVFIFVIAGLIVLAFLVSFFIQKQPTGISLPSFPTPTPVPAPSVVFKNIDFSNVFTDPQLVKQMQSLLQNQVGATEEAGFTVVSFASDVKDRNHQVYETRSIAKLVVEQISSDNTLLADFSSSHPSSVPLTLFDTTHAGSGFVWHIFPQEGTGFLANTTTGIALQVIYFSKTSQQAFLKTTAQTLNLQQQDPSAGGEVFQ